MILYFEVILSVDVNGKNLAVNVVSFSYSLQILFATILCKFTLAEVIPECS